MDHLAGISAFVAAAETASFVEAGRQLGVSSSAIGKTIARLESRFGVRLFHRNTRTMKLTAEGELFLERCHRILGEFKAAEQELSTSLAMPQGKLRISLPLIGDLLLPAISRFIHLHPLVEVDIDVTDRKVDLIEEGFDAVVRVGETTDTRLMSRALGQFRQAIVASPAYLAAFGRPAVVTDLRDHRLLLYRFPNTGKMEPWPIEDFSGLLASSTARNVACNSIETLRHLAIEGRGIACLPEFEAQRDLSSGTLAQLLSGEFATPRSLTVLWASSKQLSPKVRAFIDTLSADMATALPM